MPPIYPIIPTGGRRVLEGLGSAMRFLGCLDKETFFLVFVIKLPFFRYVGEHKKHMNMEVKKYIGHQFESSCMRTKEYIAFERRCKKELKDMCAKVGINVHSFNPNHFMWTAVLEKDGKFIYVSISDVRFWNNWYNHILVRTMKHDKDWTGGSNNYCHFDEIAEKALYLLSRG